jgi:drug/metabolite transporter (DMT)-like permease
VTVYRERAPTRIYAFMFAVLGGVLLAIGHWVAGVVLVVLALACMTADYFDNDDSSGLYGN